MTEQTTAPLAYATPLYRPATRVFAASMVLVGGLILIGLAGCFLVGVMMTIEHMDFNMVPHPAPLLPGEVVFVVVLTIIAVLAFAGATALLVSGTRALLRIAHG
jgi:hypothetical protein